jgi:hypothetical protein
MESLISSFGFDFVEFRRIISDPAILVAGSFALNGYLKQEGIESGYEPGDIDIFLSDYNKGCTCSGCAKQPFANTFNKLFDLLTKNGFKDSGKFDTEMDDYYGNLTTIRKVTSYMNEYGKEIQLICVLDTDLVRYIGKEFDLSICVSWWDPVENVFKTLNPDQTKRKEMYMIEGKNAKDDRYIKRIEKYKSRGFTFPEPPCPAKVIPDLREGLNMIDDIEAFDIFAYDDISIKDYLQQSSWHMILKVGEKFYAFHRNELYKCMSQKKTISMHNNTTLVLYDTPFNQTVTLDACNIYLTSDYSIFELVKSFDVTTRKNGIKSVYAMKCYTIQQWIDGVPGCIIPSEIH